MERIRKVQPFAIILAMLFVGAKSLALNYTISFSGTGASTTVESVIVQNLTKGTTVTVPAGNVLNLTDQTNAVEQLASNNEAIRICPTPEEGRYTMSFYSRNAGNTRISAYSIDGRKMAEINTNLQISDNSFQLLLPKGLYAIQVVGNGYTYTT
ncbi:MAG TPA: T9SS type A sorting domain-containing protein, partial [Paludibacter sp.]